MPKQVYEADVEVAAFAIFQGVFLEANQRACPCISEYFDNKTEIRTWLSQETGLDLRDVKSHLSAMHACVGYVWPAHSSLPAQAWIESLRGEIKEAYLLLQRYSPLFSQFLAEAKTYKQHNVEGAAMSMYRELQERRIISAVEEYLALVGFPVRGLIHDALLFESHEDENEFQIDQFKAELEQYASQRVRFPVKFDVQRVRKSGPLDPPRERLVFPDYTLFDNHRLHKIFFDPGIRCLVINAGMNIGKTTEVGRFFASLPAGTGLVVSTKILHATSTKASLSKHVGLAERIVSYLDADLDINVFRRPVPGQINIVQNESLHKLLGIREDGETFLAPFDYIVLDEIRSLLKQTISEKTHKQHLQLNQTILRELCLHSRCICLDADAFLDRAVAKFCRKELGGLWADHELEVHKYTHQALPRTCLITFNSSRFSEALKQAVESAKVYRERHGRSRPVVANCRSKRRVYELVAMLFPRPEPHDLPKFGDNNAFVFTGDNNEGLEIFHDINRFIRENAVDVIIYSPKLTCGTSIDEPVTAVFSDATDKGCVIRDWAQGIGRARNVDNDLIHVLMPKPRITASWSASEDHERYLEEKLRHRETELQTRLQKHYGRIEPKGFDGDILFEKFETKIPAWVINNLATNIAEEDRSNHEPASEVLRLLQYKQWGREFVDIDPNTKFGFFLPVAQATQKRQKLDQAAREQAKAENDDRWAEAFERVKDLSYDQLARLQTDKQAPIWDKASGLLFWHFAHCTGVLTAEHAKWYWKNRATFFHAQALRMSRPELEAIDYNNLLFIFKNKNLATAASILEAVGAFTDLLRVLDVNVDSFLLADGSFVLTRKQVEAASNQIDACWHVMDRVLWREHTDRNKTKPHPATLLRRIFHFFARLLEISKRNKHNVVDYCIKLDPVFALLASNSLRL